MLKRSIHIVTNLFIPILLAVVVVLPSNVNAACSPGIPCTEYDIYSNPTAGTDAALNGPKTEQYAPYTDGACDGNFMNQIYSQAWMEASREIIRGEELINKPDSVLEYTCFDQFVSIAAHHIGPIFTETTDWEVRDVEIWTGDDKSEIRTISVVFPDDTLDIVLDNFLTKSIEDYIAGSFSHTFLGGATSLNNTIDSSGIGSGTYLGSGGYDCSHMQTVWNIARCADIDEFRSFEQLISMDPRAIPAECSPGYSSPTVSYGMTPECPPFGTTEAGVNTGFYNDLIRVSNNCHDGANLRPYSAYDIMEIYDIFILSVNDPEGVYVTGTGGVVPTASPTESTVTCSDPIPTGVPIITYTHNKPTGITAPYGIPVIDVSPFIHYEYLCPNTGCFYVAPKTPYTIGAPILDLDTYPLGQCVPY